MQFVHSSPESAQFQLQALARVARAARHGLAKPQQAFLGAVARQFLDIETDGKELPELTAQTLADHVAAEAQARQLVRLMVVMSLVDGPPSAAQVSLIADFSAALGVEEPAVGVIAHLAGGRTRRFRLAFLRRSHIRQYFRNTARMVGKASLAKAVLRFRGVLKEDTALATRYRDLQHLPEGSLGHRFFHHCRENELPFPGEVGGFPEGAVFHDFTHVLTGYDTSAAGEMKNAAFQAGYTQGDHDFFTWLISIVLHTTGVNLTPFPIEAVPGCIADGNLAAEILQELKLGGQMKVDLGEGWDCWDCVELPIDVARQRLGVIRPSA